MEQENNADRRFTSFLQALERLSELLIQSIGGVSILNDEELERLCRVFYIDDPTSGYLLYRIGYWEEIPSSAHLTGGFFRLAIARPMCNTHRPKPIFGG